MHCPLCGSESVVRNNSHGEKVCTRCGLVLLEKRMDKSAEWYETPEKKSGRADLSSGSDITQHDMGLGSRLGKSKDLSPSWRAKLRRLQKWHQRARAISYKDKSLRKGLINLDKLCGDLFLPKSVKAEVSILFRKARKKKVTSGRNTWSVLAALIFMVGRMRRIPRTEKEIARVLSKRTEFNEKEAISSLRRTRKVLSRELNLEVPRPRAKEYLDRFSSNLNLSEEALTEAHEMCASLPEKFKNRKASYLVAASLIYNASRRVEGGVKIREIAEVLNVGTSSVSKTGQKIRDLVRNPEE